MSTSLLYPGFGRRGDQHVCNRYYEGAIHFHVRQDRFSLCGPAGSSYKLKFRTPFEPTNQVFNGVQGQSRQKLSGGAGFPACAVEQTESLCYQRTAGGGGSTFRFLIP
jgi:hypothetical protein